MMFCNNCGTPLMENQMFCGKCGNRVKGDSDVEQTRQINTQVTEDKSASPDISAGKYATRKSNVVLKIALSCLLSVLIFMFSVYSILVVSIREYLDSDDIEHLTDDIDVADLFEEDGRLYNKAFHRTGIKVYVNELLDDYSDYLLGERKPDGISPDDIADLFADNRHELEEIFDDISFVEDADEIIEEYVYENGEEIFGIFYEGSMDSPTWDTINTIRTIISLLALSIVLMLLLTSVVWLFFLRKRVSSVLLHTGVPVLIASLPFVIMPFFENIMINSAVASIGLPVLRNLFDSVISGMIDGALRCGFIAFAAGAVLTVSGIVANKFKKNQVDKGEPQSVLQ